MPVVEVAPRGPAAVRNRQVGARLTESQYQEVALAAQASQLTIAEWVRDTVVAQLIFARRHSLSSPESVGITPNVPVGGSAGLGLGEGRSSDEAGQCWWSEGPLLQTC
jgi:hypothetical protein